jgi:outer membrane protein assembly factor BamB
VPLRWSESENVVWRAAVPGLGWSSPVVGGGLVWLTTALDGGRSLRALAFELDGGRLVRDVEVFRKENPGSIHSKNSHASPTPVLDGKRVFVHYGAHGTACLATDGRLIWTAALEYNHRHGPAGSPVVYRDLLIVSCDGTDVQFVTALEKETGKVRWRSDRPGPMAYSTPLVINVAGRDQLLSTGGNRAVAYDPLSGKEIWWVKYEGYSLVPRPVFGHGLVFICTGYDAPELYAVRPGEGDVTATGIAWTLRRSAPHNPSPLLVGDEIYFVSDGGVASCHEARSGEKLWQKRLDGGYSASPLHAGGRIYFLNEEGTATVIAPGREYRELAVNRLPGRTLASLAVAGRSLYLRTDSYLYRLGS